LKKGNNPHIITLSPPVDLDQKWFGMHLAYTLAKYNMSMMTLGWSQELKKDGVAANSLWPATTIATAAVKNLLGGDFLVQRSRKPEIVAEAIYHILQRPSTELTGNWLLDEQVLADAGITNFDEYAVNPGGQLQKDLFLN
jgi:citronellol/citronellal dehydrogenase